MLMDPHPSQQHAVWQLQQEVTRPKARFKPTSPEKSGVDGGANLFMTSTPRLLPPYLTILLFPPGDAGRGQERGRLERRRGDHKHEQIRKIETGRSPTEREERNLPQQQEFRKPWSVQGPMLLNFFFAAHDDWCLSLFSWLMATFWLIIWTTCGYVLAHRLNHLRLPFGS